MTLPALHKPCCSRLEDQRSPHPPSAAPDRPPHEQRHPLPHPQLLRRLPEACRKTRGMALSWWNLQLLLNRRLLQTARPVSHSSSVSCCRVQLVSM